MAFRLSLLYWLPLAGICICSGAWIGYYLPIGPNEKLTETTTLSPVAANNLSEKPQVFTLSVPTESRSVPVTHMSGSVRILPWDATTSATIALTPSQTLSQGDMLITDASASATVRIGNVRGVVHHSAALEFLSTMPDASIVAQSGGVVSYSTETPDMLTVRMKHATVVLQQGTMEMTDTDAGFHLVTTNIQAIIGYIDTNNTTTIVPITGTGTLRYDDTTRDIVWKRK